VNGVRVVLIDDFFGGPLQRKSLRTERETVRAFGLTKERRKLGEVENKMAKITDIRPQL